jgi:hypothetical protein
MTPSQPSANAEIAEPCWPASSAEHEAFTAAMVNHPAPIETYESTSGVCNELVRISMNRSAVMQVYDSMFPRSGVARATAHEQSPAREARHPGRVQRALDALLGRSLR